MPQKKSDEKNQEAELKMASMEIHHHKERSSWVALVFIFVGLLLLLRNYGYLEVDLGKLWPVVIILIGLSMLLKK